MKRSSAIRIGVILLCAVLSGSLSAQDPKRDAIESVVELIAEANEAEELDYTTMLDVLNDLYDDPIDLNTADGQELRGTYLLTNLQLMSLQNHIDRNGKLLSIFELQAVQGFDLETIRKVLPFVQVNRSIDAVSITPREMLRNGGHELFIRWSKVLEEQRGFRPLLAEDFQLDTMTNQLVRNNENDRYLGSRDKIYSRYRFKYSNKLSIGFTAEKDAGEEFFRGSQKQGFDFYSAHFFMKDFGKLRRLAIGDFQAQFGQGLTIWSGLAYGKSINLLSIKRNAAGLKQYTSVDENLFLRGGGATYEFGDLELTVFGSQKGRDANIVDTLDNEIVVSSLQTSGIHARPRDLEDKDAISETVIGSNLNYSKQSWSVGLTGVRTSLDGQLNRDLQPYQQFDFNDSDNEVVGLDYDITVRNINLFGEAAASGNGGFAYLAGALMAVDPRLTLTAFHRNFSKDYQSLWANASGENSRNINERGLLLGMIFKPSKHWTMTGYFDRYAFDWLRFRTDSPSEGYEAIAQVDWKPSKKTWVYFRYRHRDRMRNTDAESMLDVTGRTLQNNYRINASYRISESVQLRNRIEWTNFTEEGIEPYKGVMLYQDLMYRPKMSPFSLTIRYGLFDTDDSDARIYTYENDVLYFYSIPGFSGRGLRYYAVGRYEIARNIDLWVKWSRLEFTGNAGAVVETIGSDLNLIEGNKRTEVRAQLRIKF